MTSWGQPSISHVRRASCWPRPSRSSAARSWGDRWNWGRSIQIPWRWWTTWPSCFRLWRGRECRRSRYLAIWTIDSSRQIVDQLDFFGWWFWDNISYQYPKRRYQTKPRIFWTDRRFEAQGKFTEAEPLFRKALLGCEEKLGKRHPHTLTLINNLAGEDAARLGGTVDGGGWW